MARLKSEMADMAVVAEIMEVTNAFKGKRFSITGHLGRPRNEIAALIEKAGGVFEKEPRWGTTYLITNQDWSAETVVSGASRKLLKAKQNGVKILSEKAFYDMLIANGISGVE